MTQPTHRLPAAWTWVPPPSGAAAGLTLMGAATRLADRARRALGLPLDGWALWRQATGGDPASAQALVRHLTPPALALARQMLRRHEDAEDAVQDAFLRLWSAQPDDQRGAQLRRGDRKAHAVPAPLQSAHLTTDVLLLQALVPCGGQRHAQGDFAQGKQVQVVRLKLAVCRGLALRVGVCQRDVAARPGHALCAHKCQVLCRHFKPQGAGPRTQSA